MEKFLCVFLLAPAMAVAAPTQSQVGRYQLFQGEYEFTTTKSVNTQKALLLLDTATGEIFECRGAQFDGASRGKPSVTVQKKDCWPFKEDIEVPKANVGSP